MWVRFLFVFLFTVALTAQSPSTAQRDLRFDRDPKRLALVIGNDAYGRWPLTAAVNDARSMAGALRDAGFEVDLATDVNRLGMERAVTSFVGKVKPGDVALFYYAGHGMQIETENYLVPVDFEATDVSDAKYDAYSASRLVDKLETSGAQLKIIVLDACRNNPYKIAKAASSGLAPMNVSGGRGVFIALATSPGKVAVEDTRSANGIFTQELVRQLKNPGLSLNDVFDRVRASVDKITHGQQTPWSTSSVIGDFQFHEGARARVDTTQSGTGETTELAFWASVKDTTDPVLFADYVRRFPGGTYVDIARRRIASLIPDCAAIGSATTLQAMAGNAFSCGIHLSDAQKNTESLAALDVALRLNPQLRAAYSRRAFVQNELGNYDRAKEDAEQALKLDPNDAFALHHRAWAKASQRNYQDAIRDYTEAIRLKPDYAFAHFDRGRAYWGMKDYDKALEDMNEALRLNPLTGWYVERGRVYFDRKEPQRAIDDYSQAILLRKDNPFAYVHRCRAYRHLQQYDRAIQDCETAAKLSAKDPQMANALAFTYASAGQVDKALETFATAIQMKSDYPVPHSNRGFLFLRMKQYDRAYQEFQEACRLAPRFYLALYGRGVARKGMGDADAGEADMARARQMGFTEAQLPAFSQLSKEAAGE